MLKPHIFGTVGEVEVDLRCTLCRNHGFHCRARCTRPSCAKMHERLLWQTAFPLKVSVPTQLQGHSDRAETVTLGLVRQCLLFVIRGELRRADFSEADLGPWSWLYDGHTTGACGSMACGSLHCCERGTRRRSSGHSRSGSRSRRRRSCARGVPQGGSWSPGVFGRFSFLFPTVSALLAVTSAGQEEDSSLTAVWKDVESVTGSRL